MSPTDPNCIVHCDEDQIVPIDNAGPSAAKLIPGAKLLVYPGAPHGLADAHKNRLTQDLLNFLPQ